MTSVEVQKLIDRKMPELLTLIKVDVPFLAQLVAEGVIRQDQSDDLEKIVSTERISAVLTQVRRNPSTYPGLCCALEKTRQMDAVNVLTSSGIQTRGPVTQPKSPIAKVEYSSRDLPQTPRGVHSPAACGPVAASGPSNYQPDGEMSEHLKHMLDALPDMADDAKIIVAVLDTGIWTQHPRLKGSILGSVNCVPGADADLERDQTNHGTRSAGVLLKFAKKCVQIVNFKVHHPNMSDISHLQRGFEKVQEWKDGNGREIDIVLTSINESRPKFTVRDGFNSLLRSLAEKKVLIASAANFGATSNDTICYPATQDSVLAIGSRTVHGQVAAYSSQGSALNFIFPGEGFTSTSRPPLRGEKQISLLNYPDHQYGDDWTTVCSGTSFAAPHCAAAVAVILAFTQTTLGAQYKALLTRSDTMRELLNTVCVQKYDAATGNGYPRLDKLDEHNIKKFCDSL